MSNEPRNLKQEAEWLRVCLDQGFISRDDVVAWAEQQLVNSTSADPSVSDVALSSEKPLQDLLGILDSFPGTADRNDIVRRFLAEAAGRVRADPGLLQRIPRILATLVADDERLNMEMAAHARRFENDLERIEFAGASVAEFRDRVLTFLDANAAPPNKALN
jgi:hypothetical protein